MDWLKNTLWPLFQRTFKAFGQDECSRLAASLAYYAVFSIFPLILLLISILGYWLRFRGAELGPGSEQQIMNDLLTNIGSNVSPDIANALETVLTDIKLQAGSSAPIALITTLMAASGIFIQLDNAFDTIWNVPPKKPQGIVATIRTTLLERGKAFALVLSIGALLIGSLVLSTILTGIGSYADNIPAGVLIWRWVTIGVAFFLNVLVFALLFYFLPKPKLRWRDVFPGAIVTALLWEIGKQLLSLYLGSNKYTASATVAAFIALLAWIYYASMIIFFGAEFCQVYVETRRTNKEAALLATLPPPPELPVVGIRGHEAVAQQKTIYAVGGMIAGMIGAVLMAAVGVVAGIVQLIRRR